MVLAGRGQVRRDVGASQPDLAVVDHGVGLVDLSLAVAQRLDLAPLELDARLHPLEHFVLVAGAAGSGGGGPLRAFFCPFLFCPGPAGAPPPRGPPPAPGGRGAAPAPGAPPPPPPAGRGGA